jgi:hypothetical protein
MTARIGFNLGYDDVAAAMAGGEPGAFAALLSRGEPVLFAGKTPTFDLMTPQAVDFDFPLVDGSGGVRLYLTTTRLVVVTRNANATTGPGFQFDQNGALVGQAIAALALAAFNGTGLALPYNLAAATTYAVLDMTSHPLQARINSAPSGGGITAATGFFIGTGYYQ